MDYRETIRRRRKEHVDIGAITLSQFVDLVASGEDNFSFSIVKRDENAFQDFLQRASLHSVNS